MEPVYRGKVNMTLVTLNPDNRKISKRRVMMLEAQMMKSVLDTQNPIILVIKDLSALEDIRNGASSEKLMCLAGHHRLVAFLNVCKATGMDPMFECLIFDSSVPGSEKFLKDLTINTCDVSPVPDFFHVLFRTYLTKERLRELTDANEALTDEEFNMMRIRGSLKPLDLKDMTTKLVRFYAKNKALLMRLEERLYIPLFETKDNFYDHGFSVEYLYGLVGALPVKFINQFIEYITDDCNFNNEMISKLKDFIKECPIFKVKNIEEVLETKDIKLLYCGGYFMLNKPYQSWSYNHFVGEPVAMEDSSKQKRKKTSPSEARTAVIDLIKKTDAEVIKEASLGFYSDIDALRVKDYVAFEREIVRVKNKHRISTLPKSQEDSSIGSIAMKVQSGNVAIVNDIGEAPEFEKMIVEHSNISEESREQDDEVLRNNSEKGRAEIIDTKSQDSGLDSNSKPKTLSPMVPKVHTDYQLSLLSSQESIDEASGSTPTWNDGYRHYAGIQEHFPPSHDASKEFDLPSSALEAFNACDSSSGSKKVKISSDAEIENDPSDKHIRWAEEVREILGKVCVVCLIEKNQLEYHEWKQCRTKNGKCLKCFHPQEKQIHDGNAVYICKNGTNCQSFKIPSPDESLICFFCLFPTKIGLHKREGIMTCSYRPNDLKYLLINIYLRNVISQKKPINEAIKYLKEFVPNMGLFRYEIIIKSWLKMKLKKQC